MEENPINLAETAAEAGVLIYRLGLRPLQVVGKNPAYGKNHGKEWQKTKFNSEEEVAEYFSDWNGTMIVPDEANPKLKVVRNKNIGVISTGYIMFGPNTQEAYDAFRAECPFYDETLQRIGNNPYPCAIFKRADEEEFWSGQKIQTNDYKCLTMADVWGDDNQFVAWGVHPKGARFRFTNNNPILPMSTTLAKEITNRVLARMGSGYRLKTQDKEEPIENAKPAVEHGDIFKLIKGKVRMVDVLGTSDTRIMCPLHKQGTSNPAAVVYNNPDGDVIFCHSCGKHADVIAIQAKKNGLTQYAAALELAKEYGIEVVPPTTQAQQAQDTEQIIELASKNGATTSELVYQPSQIILRRHSINKKTGEEDVSERIMLTCGLHIINQVRFAEPENTTPMWHITFNKKETTGTIGDIVKTLCDNSVVLCKPEEARMIVSALIDRADPPIRKIYPAVGLYWNPTDNCPVDATTTENFMAQNETQQQLFNLYVKGYSEPTQEERKDIYQASVDFIGSMPKVNRFAAFITRGYACIAPLAYELKRSNLGVFPYLYLFGEKGSSKTHIGLTAATYCWGEVEALTGQSVESSFRLGMEFSATKFPRVIDEAHDVFRKNQEIFKAGATSILATKRGNKDKTMDSYPAFCSFILTSNLPPIYEEEDAQGGVADRVLVVDCFKGDDFSNTKYQLAFAKLNSPKSRIIGRDIFTCLKTKMQEKGMVGISKEIFDIAAKIQESAPKIPARRAYCVAELLFGCKIYHELLKQFGMKEIFPEDGLMLQMIDNFARSEEDKTYIFSFMQFVTSVLGLDTKIQAGTGVYFIDDDVVITVPAITKANQSMGVKNPTVHSLADLGRELQRFGLPRIKATTHKINGMSTWGIRINMKEYTTIMDRFLPTQSNLPK